jgi:hypothetical protein
MQVSKQQEARFLRKFQQMPQIHADGSQRIAGNGHNKGVDEDLGSLNRPAAICVFCVNLLTSA